MSVSYHDGDGGKMKRFRVLFKEEPSGWWLTHCATDTEEEAWATSVPRGEKRVVELKILLPPKPVWQIAHRYIRTGGDGKITTCEIVNGGGWAALQHWDGTLSTASPMARSFFEDVTDA